MQLSRNSGRVIRLRKRNQSCSLVNQLKERMLSVRPRFAPIDRSGRIVYLTPIERHMFAVAFHLQLLQIGRSALVRGSAVNGAKIRRI